VTGRGPRASFVGRTRELEALSAAFDAAVSGRAATALVGGEAGVGKSRLVGELADHARAAGARVVVGHCLDLEEGGLPYGPFVDAARAIGRDDPPADVAAALGSLRAAFGSTTGTTSARTGSRGDGEPTTGATGTLGRARVFELLVTLVERLCAQGPVVLVVEDVHWADRSTHDLLTLLSTGARGLPLILVATYRSDEVARRPELPVVLSELTRRGATHVRLDRLDRGEVVALATSLLGTPPAPDVAAQIAERSDGVPLFVEELVAAIVHDPSAPMPPHLRDAVLARVRRLPDDAGQVLSACAVGGRQVEHHLVAGVTGLDDDVLAGALRVCVDDQLLVADQGLGGYRFRHALLHEAVLDDVLPGERARWHRAWADALARPTAAGRSDGAGDDRAEQWARLAHHRSEAGDHDGALEAAVRAGTLADGAFAVPEAHRYLEWSVRLWDRAADPAAAAGCDRGELLARAADAASRGGAVTRALTLVDEALATAAVSGDPVRAGLLHERRGWFLSRCGQGAAALDAHERAVALVPAEPPSSARARVVQAQAHELERAGRHDEAWRRANEAIAVARATGDRADEGQARHVLGLVHAAEGSTDDAVAELHAAGQIAAELGDLAEVAGAYVHLWRTLVEAGRGDDLVELILRFVPIADPAAAVDAHAPPSLAGAIAAAALGQLGRWDDAERLLGDSPPSDVRGLTAVARALVSGALAVDRGDHDLARDRLETARAWCHQSGDGRLNGLLHRALAELAVWEGRLDDARHEVATGLDLLAHTGDPELEARLAAVGLRAEADLAARTRTGAPTRARGAGPVADDLVRRLDEVAEAARRRKAPRTSEIHAARLTGQAELSRLADHPDPDRWSDARCTWDALGFPHPAAYTRLRRAEALLALGDARDEAERELRAAHTTAGELRAEPLRAAVEQVARRARIALAPRETGTVAARTGPATAAATLALTPRETEVLALVADGLTNRQIGERLFISVKTASVHVSRLLAKLGAATRGEAAAIARRQGMLTDEPPA
jgi:DNA-binding CsgD family transcriptional regulator/tetratricopeptide (TPR) repeat protein